MTSGENTCGQTGDRNLDGWRMCPYLNAALKAALYQADERAYNEIWF